MTTKLQIYNGALSLIGDRLLASLTESRESRRLLDLVYDDDGVKACLEAGQWYFAMRSQKITYDPSISPTWGFRRVFDVPSDHVRTCALCSDEQFEIPLINYREEANFWYTDIDIIYVRFVSQDTNYGFDLSLWPQSFTEFVKAHFAYKISPTVTASAGTKKSSFAYRHLLRWQTAARFPHADHGRTQGEETAEDGGTGVTPEVSWDSLWLSRT